MMLRERDSKQTRQLRKQGFGVSRQQLRVQPTVPFATSKRGTVRDYLTRTSFMIRPETFQSCTYRLPCLSQYEPCVPLKTPSIHSS